MCPKRDKTSWQQEFLEMKAHKPSDVRLLLEGATDYKDVWQLSSLYVEYKRLKKRED